MLNSAGRPPAARRLHRVSTTSDTIINAITCLHAVCTTVREWKTYLAAGVFEVLDEALENALWARLLTAAVSLRKMRSNSSGYPGHARLDLRHCVHEGRTSSHCCMVS